MKKDIKKLAGLKSPAIDGENVVFIYNGKADTVYLVGDYNRWEREDKMERVNGSDLWYIEKSFPVNARFDYKFVADGNWITDPMNEKTSSGGSGDNSLLVMPEYKSRYDSIMRENVPGGTLVRGLKFSSRYLKKEMKYHVYLPAGFRKGSVKHILYALDGSDYLNFAGIDHMLDYLIYTKEIPETAAVLVDPDDRNTEYTVYEPYCNYVVKELMPDVESEYMVSDPERALAGVSWGGLTAIYLAVSTHGVFKRVLSQSGSFWPKDWRIFDIINNAIENVIRFCLQAGTIQDTEEMNDAMAELLKAKGHNVDYQKYAETHSWFNWRGHLDEGLRRLFS